MKKTRATNKAMEAVSIFKNAKTVFQKFQLQKIKKIFFRLDKRGGLKEKTDDLCEKVKEFAVATEEKFRFKPTFRFLSHTRS